MNGLIPPAEEGYSNTVAFSALSNYDQRGATEF